MPKGHRQTRSHPALQGCTRTGTASPAKQTSKQINKTSRKPPFSVDAQLISRNIMETGWGAHEWWLLTHPQLPKPPRSLWIYPCLGSQRSRGRAGCPQKVGEEAQRPPREEPSMGSRHSTAEARGTLLLDVFWRFPTPGEDESSFLEQLLTQSQPWRPGHQSHHQPCPAPRGLLEGPSKKGHVHEEPIAWFSPLLGKCLLLVPFKEERHTITAPQHHQSPPRKTSNGQQHRQGW